MSVAIILVHYRTPELLPEALAAIDADLGGSGIEGERIIVDNGSGPADRDAIDGLGARVVRPDRNLGYAAGVNLGVERSRAEQLVFMNPDVLVCGGCIERLIGRLREGAGAVGPRLWWDRERTLLLPPTERRGLIDESLRAAAAGSGFWTRRARHRWRGHAWRHWRAERAIRSYQLSGAIMAVTREAWERVGPMDEEYRLYFEETDWLMRLKKAGLPAVYEPAAEAVHLHARSTSGSPRASEWFVESERRFRELHRSPAARWLLARLEARAAARTPDTSGEAATDTGSWSVPCEIPGRKRPVWVEVAPGGLGFPAASARVPDGASIWELPGGIQARLAPGRHTLRSVDDAGREIACRGYVR